MTIEIAAQHHFGDFKLDIAFKTTARIVAITGPSGAGKTTIINVVAGLLKPETGRVVIDDLVMVDTVQNIFIAPHKRNIGYVFQDTRLFPHLSVEQNLVYGKWFTTSQVEAASIVELLGIGHLLKRKPTHLSGGEKQRVAIGRALLQGPRLLLMDEPLSSLDLARKQEILPYLENLKRETRVPIIYVSHSRDEVEQLADEIVEM